MALTHKISEVQEQISFALVLGEPLARSSKKDRPLFIQQTQRHYYLLLTSMGNCSFTLQIFAFVLIQISCSRSDISVRFSYFDDLHIQLFIFLTERKVFRYFHQLPSCVISVFLEMIKVANTNCIVGREQGATTCSFEKEHTYYDCRLSGKAKHKESETTATTTDKDLRLLY